MVSEKVTERGQILTISTAHSGSMGQEIGEMAHLDTFVVDSS